MICVESGCSNEAVRLRRRCGTCANKRYRKKHVIKYAYENLRSNAKRRGIYFALTLTYFTKWCKETDYINLRGMDGDAMTIDRIKPSLGYIDGNIQMISRSDNASKHFKDKKEFWDTYYSVNGVKLDGPIVEEQIDLNKVPF